MSYKVIWELATICVQSNTLSARRIRFLFFLDDVIEQQFSSSFFMLLSSPLVSEMSGIQGRISNRTT